MLYNIHNIITTDVNKGVSLLHILIIIKVVWKIL